MIFFRIWYHHKFLRNKISRSYKNNHKMIFFQISIKIFTKEISLRMKFLMHSMVLNQRMISNNKKLRSKIKARWNYLHKILLILLFNNSLKTHTTLNNNFLIQLLYLFSDSDFDFLMTNTTNPKPTN